MTAPATKPREPRTLSPVTLSLHSDEYLRELSMSLGTSPGAGGFVSVPHVLVLGLGSSVMVLGICYGAGPRHIPAGHSERAPSARLLGDHQLRVSSSATLLYEVLGGRPTKTHPDPPRPTKTHPDPPKCISLRPRLSVYRIRCLGSMGLLLIESSL